MTSIAIMNAKGGVGKSTLSAALAETLSVYFGKSVLIIDADGQMSVSLMLVPTGNLVVARDTRRTLVGYCINTVLDGASADWRSCLLGQVSDVDDAKDIHLLAGDMDLPLLEREISAAGKVAGLRASIREMLRSAEQVVDVVLVDCAPGISVMTEVFLRECRHHLLPVKPDLLAIAGMQYLKRFKARDAHLGFARHLGVVVTLKHDQPVDEAIHRMLEDVDDLMCFEAAVPWVPHVQKAALYLPEKRSYLSKYPGAAGDAFRRIAAELLKRIAQGEQTP